MNRLLRLVISLAFVVLVAACGGEESSVTTLPPQPGPVLEAAAEAMSNVDYVHFKILWAGGAPIGISDFNADFEDAEGFFAAPGAANGVATLAVGNAKAQLGVISIEGQTWLTEPISGAWMDAPSGFDIDLAVLFDAEDGWGPLISDGLSDVQWLGSEERGSEPRYRIRGTADADRVKTILAGLIPRQEVEIDMWLDTSTGHIREAELSTVYEGQTSDWYIEFTEFGEPVEINPPDIEI
ncbi:MAG: LppX_LprAFG lipoprotein [Acidimicrobiia bacterium]|nr:LppX_LprAFG lipoprotein [Acidimicrobiia bacterium]